MNNRSSKFIIKNLADDKQALDSKQIEAKIEKQDELLDEVYKGLTKLKKMTQDIHTELNTHDELLTSLTQEVEETNEKTQATTEKTIRLEHRLRSSCIIS